MKTTSLFQLGAIAVLLSAILGGIAGLMYFLSGQQTSVPGLSIGMFGDALLALGVGALFARQAQRGGVLGLVGYVLVMLGVISFVASDAVRLAVIAGAISDAHTAQVPAYSLADSILPWFWVVGVVLFGISIYRAQVFPKYAGALLVLYGLLQPLTGPLAFTRPIYSVLSFVVWAWLGWTLLMDKSGGSREPAPATERSLTHGHA